MMPEASAVYALIQEGARRLFQASIPCARSEAEWVLGRLLGVSTLELYLRESPLPESTTEAFFSRIETRSMGFPLQYIIGETEFCGLRFRVFPGVFIPRPETEVLLESFVSELLRLEEELGRPLRLLELGVGSGCISVTLAKRLPTCVIVGVELSLNALEAARINVANHGLASRIRLVQGCWVDPIRSVFDGVISNPPYIPSKQIESLALDVRHEPRLSLDGGADGLRYLRRILSGAQHLLAPGGILALECAEDQVCELIRIANESFWAQAITPIDDLANRARGVIIRAKAYKASPVGECKEGARNG